MVEFRGPLVNAFTTERTTFAGKTDVTIRQNRVYALGQIAGWEGFETAARPALNALAIDGLGNFDKAQESGDCTAFRIAPDRVLLRHSTHEVLLNALALVNRDVATVLDLSHARTCIALSGPAAEDVLSKVTTLNLHPSVFLPGNFVQTGIHSVAVLIHRLGPERFDILVPFTWARSVLEITSSNARSNGLTMTTPEQ